MLPEAAGRPPEDPGAQRMSTADEPIFEAEETGESASLFDVPDSFCYVGALPESEIDEEMPTVYVDWAVAHTLQQEGQRSIREDREVAGILLGTSHNDGQIIKVSHIAIANDEDSSPVHFKFTYSVWDDLMDQMEEMSRESGEELKLVSWYHTHPNMAVFLSRYDLRTHRDFHRPYQFALVLAPKLGTAETSVGFFCNRGVGLPLLPGVRLVDAPPRKEVAGKLPWRFQVIEVEGIEEGEPGEVDDDVTQEHQVPVLQQIGLTQGEDPDWLTLGEDRVEGPVLPILEGMAASVVETKADRIGVLLGSKTPDNHITITRVRFLGSMSDDPVREREDILTSLRFMASAFPAVGEQKILGVVRIVSPHRFSAGDRYEPLQNNIRIAQFLGEVGYDLDEVPFQVGLVLYPGVETDAMLFQVFGQYKTATPLPKMSLQAIAPVSFKANERWEPVAGSVLDVEEDPSLDMGEISQVLKKPAPPPPPKPRELTPAPPAPADATSSGVDWDELSEEKPEQAGRSALPLILGVLGVLGVLVVLLLVFRGGEEDATPSQEQPGDVPEAALDLGEAPYTYDLRSGCGLSWNPTLPCAPFAGKADALDSVDLVRLQRSPAYLKHTIEPIEAWLLPADGRPKQRLRRRNAGEDIYAFEVLRGEGTWVETWGDGTPFDASIVILPRGSELELDDEWSFLRRVEVMRLVGPTPREEEPASDASPHSSANRPRSTASDAGGWIWKAGGTDTSVNFDVARRSLQSALLVTGGSKSGAWDISVRNTAGALLGNTSVDGLDSSKSRLDLGPHVTRLMRSSDVEPRVAEAAKTEGAVLVASIVPPGSRNPLVARLSLVGQAQDQGVEHKVCFMMQAPGEVDVSGQAMILGAGGVMRATHAPGKCLDGGKSSRWITATFGPGPSTLQWVYQGGKLESAKPNIGKVRTIKLPDRWSKGSGGCLGITVVLDDFGTPAQVPSIKRLYGYGAGGCK